MRATTASRATRSSHRPLTGGAALLLVVCLIAGPLQAQDWMGLVSPWSGLANPMTQSTLSPWSGVTSPLGQSTQGPWSAFSSPMTPSPWSSFPSGYGSQLANPWSGLPALNTLYHQAPYSTQPTPYAGQLFTCPSSQATDSQQPDLTGFWRGSGGESVEVQRNVARIWGGKDKPCNCVFFLVGRRLIAYSPDTDVVRKYWYQSGGENQFTLVDESGNLMTYQRLR